MGRTSERRNCSSPVRVLVGVLVGVLGLVLGWFGLRTTAAARRAVVHKEYLRLGKVGKGMMGCILRGAWLDQTCSWLVV